MITDEQFQRIAAVWPMLQSAEAQIVREFRQHSFLARIPAGKTIFEPGDPVESISLLLSGGVRVYRIGETGREITLYRFGSGESCVLTANAIMSKQAFSAIATVEQSAEAVIIPARIFHEWVGRYDVWRNFMFDLFSQRLASVMEIVDEVAFGRMDIRVARLLVERGTPQNPVKITHQEIAAELGSSREVISRILESLAGQGLIRMGRGTIEVLDQKSLEHLAAR